MKDFHTFLHGTSFNDLPPEVVMFGKRCLLDLTGVLISGGTTDLSRLIRDHVCEQFGAGSKCASVLLDGRKASPAGAALANGMTIDSIDAHDGYKPTKGHVGCHALPSILALSEAEGRFNGKEFLTNLILGYEIGGRAGIALHSSVPDYHTSGAWGAVSSAALGARILNLDHEQTRHAIGIAEYHGPRSQMMRVIDHPTMLKDGSGWGAMAGVSAAYLARNGFTGAPAITVEHEDVAHHWNDLGERWVILEQYFKAYPVCRWAQPAVEAVLSITRRHNIAPQAIRSIEVHSFLEACKLAMRAPETTEEAQYSLPFPVAASLVYGQLGPEEVNGDKLFDREVLRLSNAIRLVENDAYNKAFPQDRYAHVIIELNSGERLVSERHTARGDPEDHLGMDEIKNKFHAFVDPVLGEARANAIKTVIMQIEEHKGLDDYLATLLPQT